MTYDGFISYSHAADDLLAPRLQSGLQRFAKPWWKRRAVRIFRDEASLSANPHLWESIVEAMDESEWLVVLLSPEAAKSDWVNREIEYWAENRDPSRILPVVTEGSFSWRDGEVSGSAVPSSLRGVFAGEPRWVDMRFAHSDEQLDLKNPRFLGTVADIASTLRGVPKDELASEEVRQHRRTIRTAWAAGVGLVALSLVSVLFGIQASQQRQLAEVNAEAESEARQEAERQTGIARQNEELARDTEALAIEQAQIAESRRLATASVLARETDSDLAMLLALQAIRMTDDTVARSEATLALRDAVESHSLLWRLSVPLGKNSAALSPDASLVYHSSGEESVLRAIDVVSKDVLWTYQEAVPIKAFSEVDVSPDGTMISLSVRETDTSQARVLIFDAHTGDVLETLASEGCHKVSTSPGGFSDQGSLFTLTTGTEECLSPLQPDADWAVALSTTNWEVEFTYQADGSLAETIQVFEGAGQMLWSRGRTDQSPGFRETDPDSFFEGNVVELLTYPSKEMIREYTVARWAAMSPDGDRFVYENLAFGEAWTFPLLDSNHDEVAVMSGIEIVGLSGEAPTPVCCAPAAFSPDGTFISIATKESDFIFDASDGSLFGRVGPPRPTLDYSWSGDSSRFLTTHENVLLLWSMRPDAESPRELAVSADTVELALELLTRGFTDFECDTYNIHPCPALEEMRGG